MADFDIPVEDFEALRAMIDAGELSAAAKRFRELTNVSSKDAKFFVREVAEGAAESELDDEEEKTKNAGADFDIPVEDFEALRAMVGAGDLSAAESRFRKLTKVSAKDARFFVKEMADEIAEARPEEKEESAQSGEADFDLPVEDFKALQAMVDAGDLSAAEARFRKLTKVSAKDARFFVEEMADEIAEARPKEKEKSAQSDEADFDLPVEDFKALQAMVEAGDLSDAEARFRKLTKVSAREARFFVKEMADGKEKAELISEEKDVAKGSGKSSPEPEPVFTTIPLRADPAKTAAIDQPGPSSASSSPASKKSPASEDDPEPAYTSIDLSSNAGKSSIGAAPSGAKEEPSSPAPVKPPTSDESLVRRQHENAAAVRRDREKGAASDTGDLRWYERVLPFLGIPMLSGGLVGVGFCGLGFFLAYFILKSSRTSRGVRRLGAVLALSGSYAAFVATIIFTTGTFSLFGFKEKVIERAPIEPSNTVDWNSPASSVVEGTDAELRKILDLYYRPLDALPLVSTSIKDGVLTVVSNDVKIDSPLTGVPLLENERDLVADLGRGNSLTLLSYALRLPSDETGSRLEYISADDSEQEVEDTFRDIPVSKHRKRPVLRCIVESKRVSEEDLTFYLFDERTGRRVSTAEMTRSGVVDFRLGIWHRSPLLMVVEANAWASTPAARHPLPLGKDVALGLGRAQVAYVGRGHLKGIENGATIECGKPYQLVHNGKRDDGGMVIVRYAPPYLADSTSLLLTAIRDHLASPIPAFGDFELKPVGPEQDLLGFRVFHVPAMIDNQLHGDGLKNGKPRAKLPKIERRVEFATDLVRASFGSQRGRGLIAMDEVPGMQLALENENLFDLEIPLLVFEEGDSLQLLLQFAADAVEFDLEEIDSELKLPDFLKSIEYTNLTPRQALLDFEQLSRVRVVVDSDQKIIRLQP